MSHLSTKSGTQSAHDDRRHAAIPLLGARMVRSLRKYGLLSGAVLSVLDQAVVSGTSFLTMILIGRTCSEALVGMFALAMTIVFLLRGIQEHVIGAPFQVFRSRCEDERSAATYTGNTLLAQIALMGLFFILGIGVLRVWNHSSDSAAASIAAALLGLVPVVLLREFVRQLSFARLTPGVAVILDVTTAAAQLGGLLLIAQAGMLTIENALYVMSGAGVLALLGWYCLSDERIEFDGSRLKSDWNRNWRFGRWSLVGYVVGSTVPYVMPWLLTVSHGASETGRLAVCSSLTGLAGMFVVGVSHYLTPRAAACFSAGGVGELNRLLRNAALLYTVTVGLFLVLIVVAGDWMVIRIYSNRFAGAGLLLTVLTLNVLVNSLGVTAGNGLWAINQPHANVRADVCMLTVTLLCAAVLVPQFGAVGAATSGLVGTITGTAVRFAVLKRALAELNSMLPSSLRVIETP